MFLYNRDGDGCEAIPFPVCAMRLLIQKLLKKWCFLNVLVIFATP